MLAGLGFQLRPSVFNVLLAATVLALGTNNLHPPKPSLVLPALDINPAQN
jgi:hypothetical protein